jgi:aminotransferase
MQDRTFTLGGFSKSHFMMGLRIGFVVGPAEAIRPMKNLHYCMVLGPSNVGQAAAMAALECPRDQLEPVYKEYGRRLQALYEAVVAVRGVTCVPPQGSAYLFPNVSCFGMTALELATALIIEAGVTTLPGTEFGPYGEAHLRLSVWPRPEETQEALSRFTEWARKFYARKEGIPA